MHANLGPGVMMEVPWKEKPVNEQAGIEGCRMFRIEDAQGVGYVAMVPGRQGSTSVRLRWVG